MKVVNFDPRNIDVIERAAHEAYYNIKPKGPEVLLVNTEDWDIIKVEIISITGVPMTTGSKNKIFGLRIIPSDAIDQSTFEIY
jgi:hypothetical protein